MDEGDLPVLVVDGGVGVGCFTVEERDRGSDRGLGLDDDRLVDGHALGPLQDGAQSVDGGVLAGGRQGEAVVGEHCLRGQRQAVVGDEDTVDVTAGSGEELLEDDAALGVVPIGHGFFADGFEPGAFDRGLVALTEQGRVVVGR